ncbi:unnamed protein product [Miscanthus lutarioriparius]|uniref:Uncharacterized protein n=1 Tax=Miscanthus lutarioriparius TaxID=422564 RepID=A0A811Q0K3_9POAL|nr:unnamed protein product [Miscanthus lutarioriparius]
MRAVAQGAAAPAAPCSGAAGRAARVRPWGVGSRRDGLPRAELRAAGVRVRDRTGSVSASEGASREQVPLVGGLVRSGLMLGQKLNGYLDFLDPN